jgi:rhodanese-related sulfurtransferase
MKKIIIILLAFTVSVGYSCTGTTTQTNSTSAVVQEGPIAKDVSPKEFAELIKNKENAILLDVRTPKEVASEHLANSLHIDFYSESFKSELAKLDKSKPVLVYCHSGGRSGKTMAALTEMGFTEVYNMAGGIAAWEKADLPLEK